MLRRPTRLARLMIVFSEPITACSTRHFSPPGVAPPHVPRHLPQRKNAPCLDRFGTRFGHFWRPSQLRPAEAQKRRGQQEVKTPSRQTTNTVPADAPCAAETGGAVRLQSGHASPPERRAGHRQIVSPSCSTREARPRHPFSSAGQRRALDVTNRVSVGRPILRQ
jgi:hypothetical protein